MFCLHGGSLFGGELSQYPLRLKHQESADLLIPFLWKSQKTKMHPKCLGGTSYPSRESRRSPLRVFALRIFPSKLYSVVASSTGELKHNHDHSNDNKSYSIFNPAASVILALSKSQQLPSTLQACQWLPFRSNIQKSSWDSSAFANLVCCSLPDVISHHPRLPLFFSSHAGPVAAPQQLWACSHLRALPCPNAWSNPIHHIFLANSFSISRSWLTCHHFNASDPDNPVPPTALLLPWPLFFPYYFHLNSIGLSCRLLFIVFYPCKTISSTRSGILLLLFCRAHQCIPCTSDRVQHVEGAL